MSPVKSPAKVSSFARLFEWDQAFVKTLQPGASTSVSLIGIDEVGRGSLIGPVVAAAVCFPSVVPGTLQAEWAALNDSKKLSPAVRDSLSVSLQRHCWVSIGIAEQEEVETLNVYHASLLAAFRAYQQVREQLGAEISPYVLIDGKARLPQIPSTLQQAVIKGDGCSAVIAAASVVAKQYRDAWVIETARDFPGYGWENNMGYGTPQHLQAIAQLGHTPYHRKTFKNSR